MQSENKIKLKLIVILSLLNLVIVSVNAIPVPKGINGVIYELDGVTEVRKGVDFYLHNIDNGHMVQGKTGHGSSGRYSAAMTGNNGDSIIIKAWTKFNQVNATIQLEGVMYNVNLLLNMSEPKIKPNITSQPILSAIEDELYLYDVEAIDDNYDDILTFSLALAPTGMKINQTSGIISWTPLQEHVGVNNVIVQVTDDYYLINQSFILVVENVNDKPEIISIPITSAVQDAEYSYNVEALDEDQDILFFSLIENPIGMTIDSNSGLIHWTPTNNDVGQHNIQIKVSDGNLIDEQNYSIDVENINDLPIITSIPITFTLEDKLYSYNVEATDIDNDPLVFSLTEFPDTMKIDPLSGNITWNPTNSDVGVHNITVKVSDDSGFVLQPYALMVENVNDAPIIISTPIEEAFVNKKYKYDVESTDIDSEFLVYSLLTSPRRMKIDTNSGLIKWKPKFRHIGGHNVTVQVSDGNLSDIQSFFLNVGSSKSDSNVPAATPSLTIPTGDSIAISNPATLNSNLQIIIDDEDEKIKFQFRILEDRPKNIDRISKRVYKYLEIKSIENYPGGNYKINFTVSNEWLNKLMLDSNTIVLSRYTEDGWEDLDTRLIFKDKNLAYYTAITPGFSFFAITVRDGISVKNIIEPQISKIEEPIRITGIFYEFARIKQVPRDTAFTIQNLDSNEIFNGKTGIGPNDGAYLILLYGTEGDELKIKIMNEEFFAVLTEQDDLDFTMGINYDGLSLITGNLISIASPGSITILLLAVILAIYFIAIFIKSKKEKNV